MEEITLDVRAQRIEQYRKQGVKLKRQLDQVRVMMGTELILGGDDFEALGTNLSREVWYDENVNLPNRSIQGFIAFSRNANPAFSREQERARRRAANTAAKNPTQAREGDSGNTAPEQSASRAAALHRANHEGAEAFLRGVPQSDCPYTDPQRYAAWRMGWYEMETRVKGPA